MEAGRRIHAAIDVIDGLLSSRLGVHRNDLRCLTFLEKGPATPGEVAAHTGLTSGSVTALIDRLEHAGFVERRRTCADRRSVEITIPENRLASIRALHLELEMSIRDFFAGLPINQMIETGRALGAFAAALDSVVAKFGADSPAVPTR